MQSKLQELTDKLYAEGVQKAQNEGDALLKKAQEDAEKIVADAKAKAEGIVADANKQAVETRENLVKELKLSSQQAISSLHQQIEKGITLQVLQAPINEVFGSAENVKDLILKVVESWTKSGNFDLNLVLPEAQQAEQEKLLKQHLAKEINEGLTFEFNSTIKAGFKIGPKDGSYVISFTQEDFLNFFKAYLRPKTHQLLFEQ